MHHGDADRDDSNAIGIALPEISAKPCCCQWQPVARAEERAGSSECQQRWILEPEQARDKSSEQDSVNGHRREDTATAMPAATLQQD